MRQSPSQLPYTPYYCEENVWHLCQPGGIDADERLVAFITNPSQTVALWCQSAAASDEPVIWDYHVVLLARSGGAPPWWVFDLDTTLGFPCPVERYLSDTFLDAGRVPPRFLPRFRVIDAAEFIRTFASDRSHMLDQHGRLMKPAPPWPPIGPAGAPSNLTRFVDLADPFVGTILDRAALVARLSEPLKGA